MGFKTGGEIVDMKGEGYWPLMAQIITDELVAGWWESAMGQYG
jgi:hypothetical protein